MKKVRKALLVVVVAGGFIAMMYVLFFTTAEIPSYLMKANGSADKPANETYRAFVLKWFRLESLKSGDLILVARRSGDDVVREIRRLEEIEWPDESERLKVSQSGRHAASRRIAQTILDMDFKPKYLISAANETNSTASVRISEADIKGKVVWIKTKKISP